MKKHIAIFTLGLLCGLSGFSQEGKIHIEQDASIPKLMALHSEMAQNNKFGERYKIQIFYGNNAEATKALQEFRKEHPDWPTTIEYQTPNYKVWVGDFRTRLEADRAFREIKEAYRSAFIFKP